MYNCLFVCSEIKFYSLNKLLKCIRSSSQACEDEMTLSCHTRRIIHQGLRKCWEVEFSFVFFSLPRRKTRNPFQCDKINKSYFAGLFLESAPLALQQQPKPTKVAGYCTKWMLMMMRLGSLGPCHLNCTNF